MSKRVLVVDDEEDIVNFMERFLMRMGISVLKAFSGDEAIDICSKEMPDCVFLDVQMPGKDGITVLGEIMTIKPHLKVIMITGKDDQSCRDKAASIGACDYITKPIDLVDLNDKIQSHILNH